MNKKIIIANWKCNPQEEKEAQELFNALSRALKNNRAEIVVCPPFIYLKSYKLQVTSYKLGAQDCFWEDSGPFTGEVSVKMLKNFGVKYVLAGHSERRRLFGETDEIVNKKIKAILRNGLVPIFCIGETAEERERGESFKTLERQVKEGLKGIPKSKIISMIIAYEPVWAIGTGRACGQKDAVTAALFIKKTVSSKKITVIYGGSVNSQNAENYLKEKEISGLLVGGASLKQQEFVKICKGAVA